MELHFSSLMFGEVSSGQRLDHLVVLWEAVSPENSDVKGEMETVLWGERCPLYPHASMCVCVYVCVSVRMCV